MAATAHPTPCSDEFLILDDPLERAEIGGEVRARGEPQHTVRTGRTGTERTALGGTERSHDARVRQQDRKSVV